MGVEKLEVKGVMRGRPEKVVRPCEYGIMSAIGDMETQMGSIAAYNMLVDYALKLELKIGDGKAVAQNPYYATSPRNVI